MIQGIICQREGKLGQLNRPRRLLKIVVIREKDWTKTPLKQKEGRIFKH